MTPDASKHHHHPPMNRQPQIALFARCATIDKAFSPPRTQQKPDAPVARRRHCRENPSKSSHERTQTRHPGTLPRAYSFCQSLLAHARTPPTPSPQFPRRGTRARPSSRVRIGRYEPFPSAEGGFRSKFGDMSDPRAQTKASESANRAYRNLGDHGKAHNAHS